MTEQLNTDFQEFIGLLEGKSVRYLIVGGYAVALHGFPRYTGDIDFYVAIDEGNANALMKVFEEFGFGDIGLEMEDFLRPDFVVEIGREPRKIRVLTGIDGVTFAECYERRVSQKMSTNTVGFIGRDDLIANKIASGRPKDRIDVEALEKLKR